jgi:hypothetical protein
LNSIFKKAKKIFKKLLIDYNKKYEKNALIKWISFGESKK